MASSSSKVLEKQIPWCTIFLVTLCMTCHIMVLYGNLQAAAGIEEMGKSTAGWSNVGLSMAQGFKDDIDAAMSNITSQLTDAIIQIVAIQEMIDMAIGNVGDQSSVDDSSVKQRRQSLLLLQDDPDDDELPVPLPPKVQPYYDKVVEAQEDGGKKLPKALKKLVPKIMEQVGEGMDMLLDIIEPSLLKVGDWNEQFGDKLQAGIEQFSTTIDVVQKLFDQIMLQMNPPSDDPDTFEYMMHNTFTMFALTNSSAGITVQDLQDVAQIYSISALDGSKSEDLFQRYDTNKDAFIDKKEFAGFVNDESVPFIMAVVLRQYSKRLAQVAGKVSKAKLRDEVAANVVKYLQLVCAKNITKVGWISDMLSNNTLPLAFTADVMRNLALSVDDPEVLTTTDIGSTVIGMMTELNPENTMAAADLMANTTFWAAEGFNPQDQPVCVERVSKWTSTSLLQTGSTENLAKLHTQLGGGNFSSDQLSLIEEGFSVSEKHGLMGRALAEKNRHAYTEELRLSQINRYKKLHRTPGSKYLFNTLLGGKVANNWDPAAIAATKSGVPAVPETLLFAKWLSWNASGSAAEFLENCFNYSGQSSSAMDSFATQIQGMVKKTQAFMSMVDDYSGEDGVQNLRDKIKDFLKEGEDDLIDAIDQMSNSSLIAQHVKTGQIALMGQPEDPADPSGTAWEAMTSTLQTLTAILPQTVANLKLARAEVSALSATLDSVFDTFKNFGLPLFVKIASYYRLIWIIWFVLLTIFTLGILYYGFWASGYCGGPQAAEEPKPTADEEAELEKSCCTRWFCSWESYSRMFTRCFCCRRSSEEPNTFWDKCKCCCGSICACFCDCSETEFCFWSLILLGELFVFVLFLVSLVLVIVAGIEMFISSGCAAVYVLGDQKVCYENLAMIQTWIQTFDAGAPELPLTEVCASKSLTTCGIIENDMEMAAILSVTGAVLASVLTFQLLIESAILHERARMRKLIDQGIKNGSLKFPDDDDDTA